MEFSYKSSKTLVLASNGIAAEYRGGQLGQYIPSGEHNKSPYYLQSSTLSERDSRPLYLYRTEDNQWYVNSVLGERRGWLKNPSSSASVPETGWKVSDGSGNWPDDPQLTVRCGPLTECGDITVSSNGPTAKKSSKDLGVYKKTDIISSGRHVFKHQARERYLSIATGNSAWTIGDKPGATVAYITSAAAANCPASYRNRNSERINKKSWRYFDNLWHEDPSITVTCSNHSPLYY